MKSQRGLGGMALISVLLLVVIAVLAAFTLAAVTTSNMHMAYRQVNSQDALYLAEAVLNQTAATVGKYNTFGTHGESVTIQPSPSDPQRSATLTFNSSSKAAYSSNNVQGVSQLSGYEGVIVPSGTLRLIATGTSHGTTRTVETLVNVPPFPYALAVAGPLKTSGGLNVQGAATMQNFVNQQSGTATPLPGSIGSNCSVSVSGNPVTIGGDIIATGTVSLPPCATVGGTIKSGTVNLPTIDPTQFDPTGTAGAVVVRGTINGPASSPLTGYNYTPNTSPDLTVKGDLTLQRGLLYVKGNLTVQGGLKGTGIVVVLGQTTITGTTDLQASYDVGLLTVGNVNFTGSLPAKTYFQGLVSTQGSFTAADLTVAGVFISGGGLQLSGANVVYVPVSLPMLPSNFQVAWECGRHIVCCQHGGYLLACGPAPPRYWPPLACIPMCGHAAAVTGTHYACVCYPFCFFYRPCQCYKCCNVPVPVKVTKAAAPPNTWCYTLGFANGKSKSIPVTFPPCYKGPPTTMTPCPMPKICPGPPAGCPRIVGLPKTCPLFPVVCAIQQYNVRVQAHVATGFGCHPNVFCERRWYLGLPNLTCSLWQASSVRPSVASLNLNNFLQDSTPMQVLMWRERPMSRRGFTLVETVFAGFLLVLVFFVIVTLYPTTLMSLRKAHDMVDGANYAQQLLEQAQVTAFGQLATHNTSKQVDGKTYTATIQVSYLDPQSDGSTLTTSSPTLLKDVAVTVTWDTGHPKAGGGTILESVSYDTHVFQYTNVAAPAP